MMQSGTKTFTTDEISERHDVLGYAFRERDKVRENRMGNIYSSSFVEQTESVVSDNPRRVRCRMGRGCVVVRAGHVGHSLNLQYNEIGGSVMM